jgi:hypothetical protein
MSAHQEKQPPLPDKQVLRDREISHATAIYLDFKYSGELDKAKRVERFINLAPHLGYMAKVVEWPFAAYCLLALYPQPPEAQSFPFESYEPLGDELLLKAYQKYIKSGPEDLPMLICRFNSNCDGPFLEVLDYLDKYSQL